PPLDLLTHLLRGERRSADRARLGCLAPGTGLVQLSQGSDAVDRAVPAGGRERRPTPPPDLNPRRSSADCSIVWTSSSSDGLIRVSLSTRIVGVTRLPSFRPAM